MACTVKWLIEIALAEVGYPEKASNDNLDSMTENAGSANFTKYARDLFRAGYYNGNKQGFPWCDPYVDWTFWKACDENKEKAEYIQCQTGNLGAGCGWSLKYFKAAGRLDMNPKLGDQIFFKYTDDSSTADHTGIVVGLTATTVQTVEGNSGNKVSLRTYSRNYYAIIGYGHPRYDVETDVKTTPVKPSKPTITGRIDTVKEVQIWLNNNYAAGLSLDGLYGSYTKRALTRALQKELGLIPDGIYGKKSRAAAKKNNLKKGSKGALVKVLQGFLVCHGYKSAYVDGSFGTGTEKALKSCQTAYKLTADGVAGSNTFAALCG